MSRLPHADAIAALRERSEALQPAQMLFKDAETALIELGVIEVQHAAGDPVPQQVPGEDVIDTVAVIVPPLAEIGAIGAGASAYGDRLAARRQQLELALGHLQAMTAELHELAHAIHELQHEQHDALEAPEWAEVVAELREFAKMRDQTALAMIPVQEKLSQLLPLRELVVRYHPILQDLLLEAARTPDPEGHLAWRTGNVARDQYASLIETARGSGLVIGTPAEPAVPDAPSSRHNRRLKKEAGDILAWQVTLSNDVSRHADALEAQLEGLKEQHAHYEGLLRERMG